MLVLLPLGQQDRNPLDTQPIVKVYSIARF